MFKQEKTKSTADFNKEQNKIAPGTMVKGNIEAKGGFRIDGFVEGNVKTPGKIVIGKDGCVKGELECENADIEGKFSGILKISGTLSLRSTALIEGEASVSKLAVEPGANFNATCVMRDGVKKIHNEREKGQQQEKSA